MSHYFTDWVLLSRFVFRILDPIDCGIFLFFDKLLVMSPQPQDHEIFAKRPQRQKTRPIILGSWEWVVIIHTWHPCAVLYWFRKRGRDAENVILYWYGWVFYIERASHLTTFAALAPNSSAQMYNDLNITIKFWSI